MHPALLLQKRAAPDTAGPAQNKSTRAPPVLKWAKDSTNKCLGGADPPVERSQDATYRKFWGLRSRTAQQPPGKAGFPKRHCIKRHLGRVQPQPFSHRSWRYIQHSQTLRGKLNKK